MDIARLPVVSPTRLGPAPARQTSSVEGVAAAGDTRGYTQRRPSRAPENTVIQGELLDRPRASYQSTRAFLDERALGRARPAEDAGASRSGLAARSALSSYLNHVQPESRLELAQGQVLDFFV